MFVFRFCIQSLCLCTLFDAHRNTFQSILKLNFSFLLFLTPFLLSNMCDSREGGLFGAAAYLHQCSKQSSGDWLGTGRIGS